MRIEANGRLVLVGLMLAVAMAQGVTMAAMAPTIVVKDVGLETPESILYDRADDVYLVSNINGNPTGTDGNGFIARVSPAGRVLTLKWIDGRKPGVTLNAPKGLAIVGNTLYVSDITAVRMFDRRTGQPKGSVDIPGSTFINDLASAPDGSVYVSDSGLKPDFSPSGTDAIYRIDRMGELTTVAKTPDLRSPNGVAVLPNGRIVVVTFSKPGEVYTLGPAGQKQNVRATPAGQLDGVVALPGGVLLVSSWEASVVYRIDAGGMAKVVVKDVPSPADIGYDTKRNRVLIPIFTKNYLVIQGL
ncbi:MAG: SMP-30/gluconolactonase/LRE family protein [Armatimonadota bacterium]|nr:SMP-30/gluconolactonase/LRE family protein [Armatimonadota bacterium]MDR7548726.1 SMP-30/gluconolactonase/LRE family protein [Armatimonadota bacterium]